MAITRRQFVTRLGALAAAAGFSQMEASKIMDAVAYSNGVAPGAYGGTFGKPRVVWLHGAECTGCSTSLLGLFENIGGPAFDPSNGSTPTTLQALGLAGVVPFTPQAGVTGGDGMNFTLHQYSQGQYSPDPNGSMDVADLVIDVVDVLYHETIQGMGGDTAYQWLDDFKTNNAAPFVLVVEGAMQASSNTGAWNDTGTSVPWCSIAKNDSGSTDIVTAEIVQTLAEKALCLAVVPIGQCACFGGYPGCKAPITTAVAGFDTSLSQTGAQGVYDFLKSSSTQGVEAKVVNVPGCPTNPWWFVLSVVCLLVDLQSMLVGANTTGTLKVLKAIAKPNASFLDLSVLLGPAYAGLTAAPFSPDLGAGGNIDNTRRIRLVYGTGVHGATCARYPDFVNGVFAAKPGDAGCLQKIGCKGPATHSLCGLHGWNGQQPHNPSAWDEGVSQANVIAPGSYGGGHCTRAGHPCMACTEKGYPDSYVPFVVRS
jgi:Ni,Fe-hydrogenase I small subunit